MFVFNLTLSNCALSREPISEEFEKKMKKCGSMSGVRKVAKHAEASSVTIEINVVYIPSPPNAPLAFTIANEAIAYDVSTEIASSVALAEVGRNPSDWKMSPRLLLFKTRHRVRIVPFASFVCCE